MGRVRGCIVAMSKVLFAARLGEIRMILWPDNDCSQSTIKTRKENAYVGMLQSIYKRMTGHRPHPSTYVMTACHLHEDKPGVPFPNSKWIQMLRDRARQLPCKNNKARARLQIQPFLSLDHDQHSSALVLTE